MYYDNLTLLTDLYELTMMQGYCKSGATEKVVFDAFYRKNPCNGAYAIACGLEQVIEYIRNLHFEEKDIEGFIEKLERCYPEVQYVNKLMTHSWGQRVVRFYDPDGNLIEVGTPI